MKRNLLTGLTVVAMCFAFAACKKKPVAAKATPPPPAAQPSAPAPAPRETAAQRPVTVTQNPQTPQARMPDTATRARIQELLDRIQDAYFDYDQKTLRPDAETALKADVQTLTEIIKQYPDFKLTIEGHCDERGSDEYNLALGDARAKKALEYMAGLGLPSGQLMAVSFGKQKPVCVEHDETCWQKNRRAHLTQAQAQ